MHEHTLPNTSPAQVVTGFDLRDSGPSTDRYHASLSHITAVIVIFSLDAQIVAEVLTHLVWPTSILSPCLHPDCFLSYGKRYQREMTIGVRYGTVNDWTRNDTARQMVKAILGHRGRFSYSGRWIHPNGMNTTGIASHLLQRDTMTILSTGNILSNNSG